MIKRQKMISIAIMSFFSLVVLTGASLMVYITLASDTTNLVLITDLVHNIKF